MRQITVQERWFDALVNGTKTIEGRKASPNYINLRIGDSVMFVSDLDGQCARFTITDIRTFANVKEMLQQEGIEHCLPGVTSLEAALAIYKSFSTQEELDQYHFLAIQVELYNAD